MDKTCRPESTSEQLRKNAKQVKVDASAYKLDQVANWHEWGQVLGLRLKGLRRSDLLWFVSLNLLVSELSW